MKAPDPGINLIYVMLKMTRCWPSKLYKKNQRVGCTAKFPRTDFLRKVEYYRINNGKVSPLCRHYGMDGSVKSAILLLPRWRWIEPRNTESELGNWSNWTS